jgi:hypothetical protein
MLCGSYAVDILQKQNPYLHYLPSGFRRSGRGRVRQRGRLCNAQLDRVRRLEKQKTAAVALERCEEPGEVRRWSRASSEEPAAHWLEKART